jgi:ABC-type branched-subunit amino acid transport system substrate-binding protein
MVKSVYRSLALVASAVLLAGCASAYSTSELLEAQHAAAPTAAAPGPLTVIDSTTPGAPAPGAAIPVPGVPTAAVPGATTPPLTTGSGTGNATQIAKGGQTGSGAATNSAGSGAAATCTKPGAPLVIGQVGAWSGLVGQSAGNGRTGLAVWANYVNSRGGLACHQIRLTSVDDQSDGAKAAAAVNDLVQNKKAVALVGSFVPIDAAAYRSAIESNKVPTIGGDYVSEEWLKSPYFYPVGGSPEGVYTATMKGAVAQGKKNIAIINCVEAAACAYGQGIATRNAAAAGATIVFTTGVSLTQSDFTSQCQNARAAKADAIFYFGDGASVHRLTRSCNNLGYNPLILIPSLAAIDSLRVDPNVNKGGVVFAPSVFPWMLDSTPAQKEFQDAYRRYAPGASTDAAAATGWASGAMLEAVIAALGPEAANHVITTEEIMKGLGKIKNETLGGLIPPTTYSLHESKAIPVQCAYVAMLTNQVWQALFSGKSLCLT